MHEELAGVWEQMLRLGLGALAHANRHAAYLSFENDKCYELSILQAAHAAELLIKARIAQEHPLLIFDKLPSYKEAYGSKLHFEILFEEGKTVQWSDLPNRLWATTGMHLPCKDKFKTFGKLRNGIQHFSEARHKDASLETLKFIYEVIDPFINEAWDLFAIDFDEDYEPYIYIVSALVSRNILFRVSTEAAESFEDWDVDWNSSCQAYKDEMFTRVKKALIR